MTTQDKPAVGPLSAGEWAKHNGSCVQLRGQSVDVRKADGSEWLDWIADQWGLDWIWHRGEERAPSDIVEFRLSRLAPTAPVETLGETAAFWGNVVTGAGGAETLHPATADLVDRFAAELKSKLAKAEAKYGYLDDWSKPDWKDDLIESLAEHVQKGDPRDVAAYCAFAWHHGWSTSEVPDCFHRAPRHTDVVQALEPFAKAARMAGINSHNKPNLEQEAKRAVSWLDFSRAAKAIEILAAQPDTGKSERDHRFVPGVMRCAKCNFVVVRRVFSAIDGTVGDGDNKTEPCPNGCGPLWPMTWEQNSRDMEERCEAAVLEAANLRAQLALRPQPSGETREAAARLVDPEAWALFDRGLFPDLMPSRKTADAILALLTPADQAKGGGK
jgi:hypothetical protein